MIYIRSEALPLEIDPDAPRIVPRALIHSRGSGSSGSLDEFLNKLSIRLITPAAIKVISDGLGQSLCLVRFGFRLRRPDEIRIQWLRFSAEISHSAGEAFPKQRVNIVSFSPGMISEDLTYDGYIGISESGMIQRNLIAPEQAEPEFPAYALGYLPRSDRVVWDFFPRRGGGIPGSEKLIVAAKMADGGEAHFLEALQLCGSPAFWGRDFRVLADNQSRTNRKRPISKPS